MERVLSYPDAIREATEQEMACDPSVIVFGQGVDDPKAILGSTKGLLEKFGDKRVFDTPFLVVEHRLLYYQKGHVPEDSYTIPFGNARVLANGKDITLVGISQMAVECLRARKYLQEVGIDAEVIDPVSLYPLDINAIQISLAKTTRLIIVDNAWMTCGAGAEIIAQLVERNMHKEISIQRMGFAFVPCPTTPSLEQHFYPDAKKIALKAYEMFNPDGREWKPVANLQIEEIEFKGPF